jgi:bifunctional non-homologous end joining protein LigD
MLAKKADAAPASGYGFEVKWDGWRCVAHVKDGRVLLHSRSGKTDMTDDHPGVADELAVYPDCVLDGELVVFDDDGGHSIETVGTAPATFVVFDLLERRGQDLRGEQWLVRRVELQRLIQEHPPLHDGRIAISPVWDDAKALLDVCRERGYEGIVAKRRSSRYVEGSRTDAWLKIKLRCEQEFVVVGIAEGEGARAGKVGSMLLAVRQVDGDGFEYVGKCGTGGGEAAWDGLEELVTPLVGAGVTELPHVRGASAALGKSELAKVTWVEPELVVQVAFQRWTKDGRLWHPSWLTIRDDKDASEVVREG